MVRVSATGGLGRNGAENLGKRANPRSWFCAHPLTGGSLNTIAPLGSERKALKESRQAVLRQVLGLPRVGRGLEAGAWTGISKRLARLCGRAGETGSTPR
jgi:hypothetical protein